MQRGNSARGRGSRQNPPYWTEAPGARSGITFSAWLQPSTTASATAQTNVPNHTNSPRTQKRTWGTPMNTADSEAQLAANRTTMPLLPTSVAAPARNAATVENVRVESGRRDSNAREQSQWLSTLTVDPGQENARTQVQPPVNPHVDRVNRKISEIIAGMNKNNEYVSAEEVKRDLFAFFNAGSWRDLRAHPKDLTPLNNLIERQKSVTFYLQVWEQVFNLCTLHDFQKMLLKFMKVQRFEDLHLGPLHKNPDVQKLFNYRAENDDESIPALTSGQVISSFIQFQNEYTGDRQSLFKHFFEHLVRERQAQGLENLGIFLRSPPYLIQVSGQIRRDVQYHEKNTKNEALHSLIQETQIMYDKIRAKILDESQLQVLGKKKTATALFNHLTSVVDKHFSFIPERSALYTLLAVLREHELLKYLLSLCIMVGNMETPEALINQLRTFYQENNRREPIIIDTEGLSSEGLLSKKDRRKLKSFAAQRDLENQTHDDDETATSTFNPRYNFSHQQRNKPPVSLKDLCHQLRNYLIHAPHRPGIEQLVQLEESICDQYDVNNFSVFNYDNEEDGPNDAAMSLLTFLHRYRTKIDPEGELAIYDEAGSLEEREDIYGFIRQLNAIYHNQSIHHDQQQQVVSADGDLHGGHHAIDSETLSAVEKVVRHKFGQSVNHREAKQMLVKALESHQGHESSKLHFEESLLDQNSLIHLDLCPASLHVSHQQLCQSILNAPVMIDLNQWLQWQNFFQPKYGSLKSFINQNEDHLPQLQLLETSSGDLFRLPSDATMSRFNEELQAMHVRSAVGYLCALMIQAGVINQFSFTIYQTLMESWCRRLRSLATLEHDRFEPMEYILEFLMYVPGLLGQKRVIEELVLGPVELVFQAESNMIAHPRAKIWELADPKQRSKLELWGCTLNIDEWKNEGKWSGEVILEDTMLDHKKIVVVTKEVVKEDSSPTQKLLITNHRTDAISVSDVSSQVVPNSSDLAQSVINKDAFEHIKAIRRQLGADTNLDAESQGVVDALQGVVKRTLDKISVDLYSEEGHFVLELIQNADDNQYNTENKPTLCFTVSSKRILVCNNEVGFQPENIAAICNAGASTKGKHKEGYAGHKGIGFKSVFMVSHRPEVHSRDYHICFDTADGKDNMGCIRPIWLDQSEEPLPDANTWTTCIRLPIRSDVQMESLQRKFDNIQGKLLLFLNRLRKIQIINEKNSSSSEQVHRTFTRIDHKHGPIIELQEESSNGSTSKNHWLVVKKVLEVPENIKNKLRDVKGEIEKTTIAIAYPLNGIEKVSDQLPPAQPLFAYLPLCSYGFRFILQADFEIPASRQDIRRDNLWNDWLKSEMPQLLYYAYLEFQKLPELLSKIESDNEAYQNLTSIQTIKYFLKLLPSRHELNPYFHSFIDQSFQLLMGVIKLPVVRSNANDNAEEIEWVMPSQCVLVRDPLIRKILSEDLLLSHFNSYYVHQELIAECDEKILIKLGCRQLDFADITRLIEISYDQSERDYKKTPATIQEIAQWFICLDYSLQQQREQLASAALQKKKMDETLAKLKKMKIIPLKSQAYFVSMEEYEKNTVLFPWEKSQKYSKDLKLILEDVPVIDTDLLTFIEEQHPRRLDSIRKLLQKLGVKETPNIRDIYHQQIFPTMMDPKRWKTKSNDLLIAYVICFYHYYCLEKIGFSENDLNHFQKSVVIKNRQNQFVSLSAPDTAVHLTTTYGCQRSLESIKYPFHFVSDEYCSQYRQEFFRNSRDILRFRQFLEDISITEFLQINAVTQEFKEVGDLQSTPWEYLINELAERIYHPFQIRDYSCSEFERLLASVEDDPTKQYELCTQLVQYLQDHYENTKGYYVGSVVIKRSGAHGFEEPIKGIPSSFCSLLRKRSWIPVSGNKLLKPSEVYFLPPNNNFFCQYVPHVDMMKVHLINPSFIYDILEIKKQVAPKTMFELLLKWSCNLERDAVDNMIKENQSSPLIECTLPSTHRPKWTDQLENFRLLYSFLASDPETMDLLTRFRAWPLIFVPNDSKSGHFVYAKQVYWKDPINQLVNQDKMADSSGRIAVGSFYEGDPRLEQLFLNIFHIEPQPGVDDYLPLLSKSSNLDKTWTLIQIITRLAIEQKAEGEIREKLRDIEFIPTLSDAQPRVSYTDQPLYPHDAKIADLFANDLLIIQLPEKPMPSDFKRDFCSLFNLKDLKDVVRTEVEVEQEKPSIALTKFYRETIDLIQHFLLDHKWISDDRSKDLAQLFNRMKFLCVNRIQVYYLCEGKPRKSPKGHVNIDTYVDTNAGKFYILEKFENSDMRYVDAMANFLVQNPNHQSRLIDHMRKILRIYQDESTEGLNALRKKHQKPYEPKWIIPDEIEVKAEVKPEEKKPAKTVTLTDAEIEAIQNEASIRVPSVPNSDKPKLEGLPQLIKSHEPLPRSSDPKPAGATTDRPPLNDNKAPREHTASAKRETHEEPVNRPPMEFTEKPVDPSSKFESIVISDLKDLDLSKFTIPIDGFATTLSEEDKITGRQGEEVVYRLLQRQHSPEKVIWVNDKAESGGPYDIYVTLENNEREYIEVKSTRVLQQHVFPISIAEAEFLLKHPKNYFIYRVYLNDPIEQSRITRISKVEENLKQKNLRLLMSMISKSSP